MPLKLDFFCNFQIFKMPLQYRLSYDQTNANELFLVLYGDIQHNK